MSGPLVVLQSFPEPRETTNPYVVQLRRSLEQVPELEVLTFSWGRALRGRYDVFHVHWPETLLEGRSPARRLLRLGLFALLLLRLRLRSTAVVATVHNLRPQEHLPPARRLLLRLLGRGVALRILLNPRTEVPAGTAAVTIPHGHYRDWFAALPRRDRDGGRLVHVGFIRAYKNVPALVRTFRQAAGRAPHLRLEIAGRPRDEFLAAEIRQAAGGDPRVGLRLDFLDDAALVHAVTGAGLVVLPYSEMHNSGAALMALSLDRPVLVPDNPVNRDLAAEAGEGWVLRYRGELSAERLLEAVGEAARLAPGDRPELGARDWDRAGTDHLTAYRRAVATARR